MTRTSKTGINRLSCLPLYLKFTTWYRSYKVTDLCLEAFRSASGYSAPTTPNILFEETFMSKRTHDDTRGDVYYDRQVLDAFTRAGYTLESDDEDENGCAPLIQVKQTSTLSVNLN